MEVVSFHVEDMTCGGCAARIDSALKGLDETAQVEISVADRLVHVRAQAAEPELAAAIRQAGYTPVKAEGDGEVAPQAHKCCCGGGGGGCSRA
jgi:copper chaperone